jgi:hypothetical protein
LAHSFTGFSHGHVALWFWAVVRPNIMGEGHDRGSSRLHLLMSWKSGSRESERDLRQERYGL